MSAEGTTPPEGSPASASEVASNPSGASAPPPRSLGQQVGRGFSWLTVSFFAGKVFSFIAQIALGILLLDEEFGLFAIASSVATFAKVFHDAGIAQVLIQRGPDQFPQLRGPSFWMGLSFSLGAGLILAIAAPLAGMAYQDSELTVLLWIIAASLPLAAPAQVPRAKLRMDLRFRALSMISVGGFAIRQLGAVALAYMGFGARSFVLPMLAVALFDDIAMTLATRDKLWSERPNFAMWRPLLASSGWVIASSFFSGLLAYGDYLVLGLLLSKAIVGQYYFGYQFTLQAGALVSVNLQYVLLPVLSRLANERSRQATALVRTFRVLLLIMAPFSLSLVVTIAPLETLIWNNKWAAAVPLMQIFAIASPVRLFTIICHAMLTSHGKFHIVALVMLLEGLVLMAAAWLSVALVGADLTGIAVVIATAQALYSITLTAALTRRWGIASSDFFRSFMPAWTVAIAAAVLVLLLQPFTTDGLHPILKIIANFTLFSACYLAAMRALFSWHFAELIAVTPRRLADVLRRVLLIAPTPATAAKR